MLRIPSLLIAVVWLWGCTRLEGGPQDSKRATEQHDRSAEVPEGSRGAGTGAAAPADAKQQALTNRHHDARFDFELAFPSDWEAAEGPGMPALFVTSPRESASDAFVENVNVVVEELPAPMSAEAYADGSALLMQTDLTEYRELARSKTELDGEPAVRREYEHTFMDRELWVVSYMVTAEKHAYVITATAEREHADVWRTLLESVARSFRLTIE